ncbi:MAG TPA: cystathionine gamma-synthase [Fimbriimonadaceae bacterium]|nr:cystathionine gamma-synthase [Fimbriimonadaceae bacterium]
MPHKFETLAIHAGVEPESTTGAVMTPIFQTSTYAQTAPGQHRGYEYSRTDNPTRTALQTSLSALERTTYALVFSSGMAAIDAWLNTLSEGDHVIAGDDLYGGTYRLFSKVANRRGIDFSFADVANVESVATAVTQQTKWIWFETPTNPLLKVIDVAALSEFAKPKGIKIGVDNTFMSPYFQNPAELGADVVMHSMTKYINGHSDVVMGALMLTDQSRCEQLKFLQNAIGATPGPFDCFLVLRGIKSLAVRMQRHGENAQRLAQFLSEHPKVERVIYPGLQSHPQHELASNQARGYGGMLSFYLRGGLHEASNFLSSVRLFTLAESLGGVESLIEHPAIMTHASLPPEIREASGISDNFIRVSVGLEHIDDLIADINQALG